MKRDVGRCRNSVCPKLPAYACALIKLHGRRIFLRGPVSMVTCHIGFRGAVIARFSMWRPLHSSLHCGLSWSNRNAEVKTILTGIPKRLTHIHHPRTVHIVPIFNASFHFLAKNCTSLIFRLHANGQIKRSRAMRKSLTVQCEGNGR